MRYDSRLIDCAVFDRSRIWYMIPAAAITIVPTTAMMGSEEALAEPRADVLELDPAQQDQQAVDGRDRAADRREDDHEVGGHREHDGEERENRREHQAAGERDEVAEPDRGEDSGAEV